MNNEKKYNQPQSAKVPFRGFRGVCLFVCLLLFLPVSAQRITIDAQIDSTVMWIGHQTPLTFEVSQQPGVHVDFPFFSDFIPGGLEIVGRVRIDSVLSADGYLQVRHRYTVTAFQDSLFFVPAFPFVVAGDTTWSPPLALRVLQPFYLDPESNAIADIKTIFEVPPYWGRIIRIVLWIVLAWLALALLIYLIVKFAVKKPAFETEERAPETPSHIEALNGLDKIKEEKTWQQGRLKEYYTELTDIIRVYIGKVFEVNAMEMTSEEVLDTLRYIRREHKEAYENLQKILQVSDLVKFAKWIPTPDESERSLREAYNFVNDTTALAIENEQEKFARAQSELLRKLRWAKIQQHQIKGIDGLNLDDIENELNKGARFVTFTCCISVIVTTFTLNSGIYFIRPNEKPIKKSWAFLIISALFGWWGIPWGPLLTINAIKHAVSGKDVSTMVMNG